MAWDTGSRAQDQVPEDMQSVKGVEEGDDSTMVLVEDGKVCVG